MAGPVKKKLLIGRGDRSIVFVSMGCIVVFYGLFFIYPLIYSAYGSFFEWDPLIKKFDFTGISNYVKMAKEPSFWKSLENTFVFTVVMNIARIFLGLFIAVAINSVRKFRTFFRTAYFLPVIASLLAASLIWGWIFDPNIGIVNTTLKAIGFDVSNLLWLQSPKSALYSVMIMTIWKDLGFSVVLYLAGLSVIPSETIEAAAIDGASPWNVFWRIKFPLLQPTTIFVLLTGTISYLQVFTQIFILTKGGPYWSTSSILYLIYYEAFSRWNFGYAAAITQVLFVIIVIIALFQFWAMRRFWKV